MTSLDAVKFEKKAIIEGPKLHGWITPEYARSLAWELINFIVDNENKHNDILLEYYQGGNKEGTKLHRKAAYIMAFIFGEKQDNYTENIAEQLSDYLNYADL